MSSYHHYNHKRKFACNDGLDKLMLTFYSTPGYVASYNLRIKDGTKLDPLLDEVGKIGPVLDLTLRSMIPMILIRNFNAPTEKLRTMTANDQITNNLNFVDAGERDEILDSLKKWQGSKVFTADFDTCTRTKRALILNTWIDVLTNKPQKLVLNSLANFQPDIKLPRSCFPLEVGGSADPKCTGIFGIKGYNSQTGSLIFDPKSKGPWLDAVKVVNDYEMSINAVILSLGSEHNITIPKFDASSGKSSFNEDFDEIYEFLDNLPCQYSESTTVIRFNLGVKIREFSNALKSLQLHALTSAFVLNGKLMLDLFYKVDIEGVKSHRTCTQFANLFAGEAFLGFYYKTAFLILIEKHRLENSLKEIHTALRIDNGIFPTLHLFNEKMTSDLISAFGSQTNKVQNDRNFTLIEKIMVTVDTYRRNYLEQEAPEATTTVEEDSNDHRDDDIDDLGVVKSYRKEKCSLMPYVSTHKKPKCQVPQSSVSSSTGHSNISNSTKSNSRRNDQGLHYETPQLSQQREHQLADDELHRRFGFQNGNATNNNKDNDLDNDNDNECANDCDNGPGCDDNGEDEYTNDNISEECEPQLPDDYEARIEHMLSVYGHGALVKNKPIIFISDKDYQFVELIVDVDKANAMHCEWRDRIFKGLSATRKTFKFCGKVYDRQGTSPFSEQQLTMFRNENIAASARAIHQLETAKASKAAPPVSKAALPVSKAASVSKAAPVSKAAATSKAAPKSKAAQTSKAAPKVTINSSSSSSSSSNYSTKK